MKLVVGLGNPGRKYQGTRHNVGFRVLAALHERFGQPRPSSKFDSEIVQIQETFNRPRLLLQSPLTYMNRSGRAVRGALDFFKIPLDDLLVVCDDFNLDLGRIRFRPKGSAGGQNGLKDIIQQLGTQEFSRLRIGIGKPPPQWDVSRYVLSQFRSEEADLVETTVQRAADGVMTWAEHGIGEAMNRFNADPRPVDKGDRSRPGERPSQGCGDSGIEPGIEPTGGDGQDES